ncbi:MAG TPA: MlaD family protein [Thermoleophilaceae bacterium]|jgi:virulence factor Mce-like protein
MNKSAPTPGRVFAMVGFTLSVFGLLLFLWIAFGGTIPLHPKGYRVKVAFPEASLLVQEADVRMAGVNIGKVKEKELAPGGRRTLATLELDSHFAPIPRNTRAILRSKSLLGETYVELTPGDKRTGNLPDGGTLPNSQVQDTVELDEIFKIFDERTRQNFRDWIREAGIATGGDYARDLNDSIGNLAPFFEGGADLLRPLDEQELALKRLVRNTGRVFDAISAQDEQLGGLIRNGEATFGALASRDESLAETFHVFPTFLRETRATVQRLEAFSRNTDPLVRELAGPARDLGPTLRDLGDLSPDLTRLFRDVHPLVQAARTGVPAADRVVEGAEPLLTATHGFLQQANPILSYLGYSKLRFAQFLSLPAAALAGNGAGGYSGRGGVEHYLPQVAVIDGRSLQRRTRRPPWERANAYTAPNAYVRAIPLGAIESFDCDPSGGEKRDASGSGETAAPPCFVAPPQLFQHEKFPHLRRGRAPLVPGPTGLEGTRPAVP